MKNINNSINFVSSISFSENTSRIDSFSIMTFLWNQTVMKIVVKMAQIKKIQRYEMGNQIQYYFHLNYPAMFYLNQLKNDQANSVKFMKFPDRVTNFPLI